MKRRPCSKCGLNRAEKFYGSPRARVCNPCQKKTRQDAARDRRLRETYGITLVEYNELLAAQEHRCYICQRKPRYNMDVDHDHKTGLVRGLLCKLCNRRLLPSCRDNPHTLLMALSYLKHPPALKVLGERYVPADGGVNGFSDS